MPACIVGNHWKLLPVPFAAAVTGRVLQYLAKVKKCNNSSKKMFLLIFLLS
jgi:hypothetical protein